MFWVVAVYSGLSISHMIWGINYVCSNGARLIEEKVIAMIDV